MEKNNSSPYLQPNRLSEVIAAIQVLGTFKFYKLEFAGWQKRIDGMLSNERATHWNKVFKEHPEFFRIDSKEKKASLVLRRTFDKLYNVDSGSPIDSELYRTLSGMEKKRISRRPLSSEEVLTLVNVASTLHDRAIAQKQERRWWIDPIIAISGFIVGALAVVVGAWIQKGCS